jgi:hypothetical protein
MSRVGIGSKIPERSDSEYIRREGRQVMSRNARR